MNPLATLALAATLITWHYDGTLTFLHDEPCTSADLGGWLEERFHQPAKRAINIARDGREIAACWVEYDDGKAVVVLSADDRVRSKLYVD